MIIWKRIFAEMPYLWLWGFEGPRTRWFIIQIVEVSMQAENTRRSFNSTDWLRAWAEKETVMTTRWSRAFFTRSKLNAFIENHIYLNDKPRRISKITSTVFTISDDDTRRLTINHRVNMNKISLHNPLMPCPLFRGQIRLLTRRGETAGSIRAPVPPLP